MYQTKRAALAESAAKQGGRRSRGAALLLIVLLLAVFVSACGSKTDVNTTKNTAEVQEPEQKNSPQTATQAKGSQTQTVKHWFGETKAPLHPQRIAVIGLEDILLSLDAPLVYAYGFKGYYLNDQLKKLSIQTSNSADIKPNLEAILATQPDIIFLQKNFTDQAGYDELSKIAPTLAFAPDDWKGTIVEIGKILGVEDKAKAVIQAHDDKIKQAKAAIVSAVGADQTLVYMRPSNKDVQVFFPSFNFVYRDLGLKPDASIADFQKESSDDWGINTSLEKLPSITADYIFAIYGGSIDTEDEFNKEVGTSTEVEKLQVWKAMPAVKQNHVFKVSARHWMSSGPIAEGREIDDVVAAVTGKS